MTICYRSCYLRRVRGSPLNRDERDRSATAGCHSPTCPKAAFRAALIRSYRLEIFYSFNLDRMYHDPRRFGLIVYGLCCAAASVIAWWTIYSYILLPVDARAESAMAGSLPVHAPAAYTGKFPQHGVGKWIQADVTAYSPYETCPKGKSENCINATGRVPTAGKSIACPRQINKGRRIRIAGKEYLCDDRTAYRLNGRFDIFMLDYEEAIRFGKQRLTLFIYD